MRHHPVLNLFHSASLAWMAFASTAMGQVSEVPIERPAEAPPEIRDTLTLPSQPDPWRESRSWGRHRKPIFALGEDVELKAGEVAEDVIVIGGNARIDGHIRGNLTVVFGSTTINGEVDREVFAILGPLTLGPTARLDQELVNIGGPFTADPKAYVGRDQVVIGLSRILPSFAWMQDWFTSGLLLARPFPPQFLWGWAIAGLLLVLYLGVSVMFPQSVLACTNRLEQQPVGSFFAGMLMLILAGPLLFLLAVSVAGIPVIPIVLCAFISAIVLGKLAVYSVIGQRLLGLARANSWPLPLVVLVGTLLLYVVYMVPVIGFIAWGLITVLGLGAVLLAAFRSLRREEVPAHVSLAPTPPPLSSADGGAPEFVAGPSDVLVLNRVGFWRRFWAALLDWLLLSTLIPIVGPFIVPICLLYYVGMWSWKGTSIGGIIMSIQIFRVDGQPVTFWVALVRSLASFFSALALFLGFFWAGWDREKQAWHDKIAGTMVVRLPKGAGLI